MSATREPVATQNPAGSPRLEQVTPEGTISRDDFLAALRKIKKSQPQGGPSQSEKETPRTSRDR